MLPRFVRFGEFELDREGFQLRCQGTAVKLENLPLQLLMLLVARRGEIVSREEIEERLWGKDVFVDVQQGINTAIRKVRLVLRDHPERPRYLQTVVGKGYRFLASEVVENDTVGSGASLFSDDNGAHARVTMKELGEAILAASGLQALRLDLTSLASDIPENRGESGTLPSGQAALAEGQEG